MCYPWGIRKRLLWGVNVRVCKGLIIAAATLSTAAAVCISGVIGWIGLVITAYLPDAGWKTITAN